MINWYKQYDQETFQNEFSQIDYKRYNPFAATSELFVKNKDFDQIVNQFTMYLKEQIPLRKLIDPLSDIIITSIIKQLQMIY